MTVPRATVDQEVKNTFEKHNNTPYVYYNQRHGHHKIIKVSDLRPNKVTFNETKDTLCNAEN